MAETEFERLQRALRVHERFLEQGGGAGRRDELLGQHEDLRELLAPLLADEPAEGPHEGGSTAGSRGLLGDYALGAELGRGGMGIVYEAVQMPLGRRVAVKVLHPGLVLDARARQRFVREARLAAGLDHRAITRVLSADVDGDVAYYAMERVDGASLDRVLRRLREATDAEHARTDDLRAAVTAVMGAVDAATAAAPFWQLDYLHAGVQIAIDVAGALQHAHDRGVVHRDVKPANILLRADGSVALTDFGLAREFGNATMTATGDLVGTPYYSAPEQIAGSHGAIDGRTDVFSLGVTLYELLTLRRPFEADTAVEVRQRIVTKEPLRPHRVNRRVPRDLAAIVLTALEKDPDRRYRSAAAFADDLRNVLAGRPVAARPVRTHVVAWRWARRNPIACGLLGALLLLCAAIGTLAWYAWSTKENERLAAIALNLEVGRLLTQGNDARAEPRLWRAQHARPDRFTHWALVEFYRRFRVRATLGDPADPFVDCWAEGDRIATLTRSGECTLWDARTLQTLARCALGPCADASGLLADADRVYVQVDGEFRTAAWQGGPVERVRFAFGDDRWSFRWPPRADGRWLFPVSSGPESLTVVRSYDRDGGDPRTEIELPDGTRTVERLGDGEYVGATSRGDVWWRRGPGGRFERVRDGASSPVALQIVPGCRDLVINDARSTRRWTWQHDHWVEGDLLPCPEGPTNMLADGSIAGCLPGRIVLCDPAHQRRTDTLWIAANRCMLTPGGLVARYPDGSLRIWDVATDEPRTVAFDANTQHTIAFTDDRTFWCGGEQRLASVPSRGEVQRVRIGDGPVDVTAGLQVDSMVTSIAVAPDRRHVAIGQHSPLVRVTACDDSGRAGAGTELDAGTGRISFVAFAPGGQWLAAAGDRAGQVAVWPAPFTGEHRRLLAADCSRFAAVAFAGEDLLLAAGAEGALVAWHLDAPEPRGEVFYRHPAARHFRCLATWRQDGEWFAIAGNDDGNVYALRARDLGAAPRVFAVSQGNPVYAVAVGRFRGELLLASADSLGAVQLWDPMTGQSLCALREPQRADLAQKLFGLAFAPDGELLVAAGEPNVAVVFSLGYAQDRVAANTARARFGATADEQQR
ncbi:MAG TPA: WD40 repeat domain-containing serine/threonine protein kinase [Planctomycetota bacterium]|nr:WD40 repeat domain-containing serine/threonine protein kinase [Planctomycetota bacterium]